MTKGRKKKDKHKNPSSTSTDTDTILLNEYLKKLNLKLIEITGDGACLFRSLSHQMHGTENHHSSIRSSICDYMDKNPSLFEPFLIDESISHHVNRMRHPTTFGTHLELVAFTHVYQIQVIIHQLNTPAYILSPPENSKTTSIHIVYHSFEHYSSTLSTISNFIKHDIIDDDENKNVKVKKKRKNVKRTKTTTVQTSESDLLEKFSNIHI